MLKHILPVCIYWFTT